MSGFAVAKPGNEIVSSIRYPWEPGHPGRLKRGRDARAPMSPAKLMNTPLHLSMRVSTLLVVAAASTAVSLGTWLLLRRGKKKSDAEKERDRRAALNAIGRMTDGTLIEALDSDDPAGKALLFYRYSIRGVEYSAAQDVSCLRNVIPAGTYLPGEAVIVKYDQHHPSNSIVVSESWSGLQAAAARRKAPQ